MHAHGIHVFNGADDNHIVVAVAHHLQFKLLPAQKRALQHNFAGHGQINAGSSQVLEFSPVVGHAATSATQGEAGAHNHRKANTLALGHGLFQVVDNGRFRYLEPDFAHGVAEFLSALCLADHADIGCQEFNPVLVEYPHFRHPDGRVEPGLAAQGGQKCIRPFALNHLGDKFRGNGLDIGTIGQFRVGHDGGWVRVDQHHLIALFLKRLDRLRTGIVELAGLADDDRPGTNDEDFMDICPSWHVVFLVFPGS